ncbi:hypothetical protein GXW82_07065 [Streptacidiphilus sp. 4-A2]|nr:hypothetical protein [Streptacidiphilus sp. 4-A2]
MVRDLGLTGEDLRLSSITVNVMPYDYGLDFAGSSATSRVLSTGPVDDVSLFICERSEENGPLVGFDINETLYRPEDVLPHQQCIATLLNELAAADPQSPVARLRSLDQETAAAVLANGIGAPLDQSELSVGIWWVAGGCGFGCVGGGG